MKTQTKTKRCKHNWHYMPQMDNIDVKMYKVSCNFICDKYGNIKKIERGYLIK